MSKQDDFGTDEFIAAINEDNHRAVAVSAAAELEYVIKEILNYHLKGSTKIKKKLLDDTSPITHYWRVTLLFAMDKIDKTVYDDLLIINTIRSKFAHGRPGLTFENEKIVKLCNKLKHRFPGMENVKSSFNKYRSAVAKLNAKIPGEHEGYKEAVSIWRSMKS